MNRVVRLRKGSRVEVDRQARSVRIAFQGAGLGFQLLLLHHRAVLTLAVSLASGLMVLVCVAAGEAGRAGVAGEATACGVAQRAARRGILSGELSAHDLKAGGH